MSNHENHSGAPIKRFGFARMLEHHANAIVFFLLVLTGMAQRFHDVAWAQWVVMHLGGIDNVRIIHRTTGVIFSFLIVLHITMGAYGIIFKGWRPSMIVNRKDFLDAVQNIRFYLGATDRAAQCDRYDYKQKFEYWGVIMGGFLMIGTGWLLWFPTKLFVILPFLPGQLVPAAKVAHSNEALMAFLIIVIWHIYNAVFSPEVFPLDTTIFTGKISRERMHHEHPLELVRIEAEEAEAGAASAPAETPSSDPPSA